MQIYLFASFFAILVSYSVTSWQTVYFPTRDLLIKMVNQMYDSAHFHAKKLTIALHDLR